MPKSKVAVKGSGQAEYAERCQLLERFLRDLLNTAVVNHIEDITGDHTEVLRSDPIVV